MTPETLCERKSPRRRCAGLAGSGRHLDEPSNPRMATTAPTIAPACRSIAFQVACKDLNWTAMHPAARRELEKLFEQSDPITVDPRALERTFTVPARNRVCGPETRTYGRFHVVAVYVDGDWEMEEHPTKKPGRREMVSVFMGAESTTTMEISA